MKKLLTLITIIGTASIQAAPTTLTAATKQTTWVFAIPARSPCGDVAETFKHTRPEEIAGAATRCGLRNCGNLVGMNSKSVVPAGYSSVLLINKNGRTICDTSTDRSLIVFTPNKSEGLKKLTGFSGGKGIMCLTPSEYQRLLNDNPEARGAGYVIGEVS